MRNFEKLSKELQAKVQEYLPNLNPHQTIIIHPAGVTLVEDSMFVPNEEIDMSKEKKQLSEMTEKEILRQQLELLAEHSQEAFTESLPELTETMIDLAAYLEFKPIDVSFSLGESEIGKARVPF